MPAQKEPALFSVDCNFRGTDMLCPDSRVQKYLDNTLKKDQYIDYKGQKATFEATPSIVEVCLLCEPFRQFFCSCYFATFNRRLS